jgi:Tol biopolymer transport system component
MGEVYRARDTKLNRDVALKILLSAFALDAERLARFKREAQVLASLNHPNIAAIYGFEDSGDVHALVLELVEGPTLADRIATGAIVLGEALSIAKQIAEGLQAAHEQGIIHRDLKPANIKIRDDGTVKVLDFGLAKAMEPASAIGPIVTNSPTITSPAMVTGIGTLLGTAAYMSPEQAKGRPADKRSDVWGFGCVLFEMVAGRRAFDGEDVSDTLAAVLRAEPDWSRLPPAASPSIRNLLEGCLAKDRQRRAGDISVALFVLSQSSALAANTPNPPASSAFARKTSGWRQTFVSAAAVAITAAVVAVGAWVLRPATVAPAVVRFTLSVPDLAIPDLVGGIPRPYVALSPDGSTLAYIAGRRLYIRALSDSEPRLVTGDRGDGSPVINTPVFSPDGRSLAFYSASESAIKQVAIGGGAAVTVCAAEVAFGMTWDASGIVFGQRSKGIFRCSPNGATAERLIALKNDEVPYQPQILPGGKSVLFTLAKLVESAGRWDNAQIVIETLATHERRTLLNRGADARYLSSGHLVYALGGVVYAVGFDPARQVVRGGAVPVIEGVRRSATTTGAAHFVTSDTGALAYVPGPVVTSSRDWAIGTQDRSGTVTKLSVSPGPYDHVRASSDGAHLAIGSDDGTQAIIWIWDLDGKRALRRLTFGGQNRFPIWSPDGSRIAFQSNRDGDAGIFIERAGGGGVERLTKTDGVEAHTPGSWSHDGRFIVFSSKKAATYSLHVVSVADKKVTPFSDVRSAEPMTPVFSPDSRWVAYASLPVAAALRTPERGVFVDAFPASGDHYQVPHQNLDFHPAWGSKGSELFYIPSAVSGQIAVVNVVAQPHLTFGRAVMLPARVTGSWTSALMRAWDVLPDGRIVGIIPPLDTDGSEGATQQIRVVLNWFEELKQRVRSK